MTNALNFRKLVLEQYRDLSRKLGHVATRLEFRLKHGGSGETAFGTFGALKEAATKQFPELLTIEKKSHQDAITERKEEILEKLEKFVKKNKKLPSYRQLNAEITTRHVLYTAFESAAACFAVFADKFPQYAKMVENTNQDLEGDVYDAYCDIIREIRRMPKHEDLAKEGFKKKEYSLDSLFCRVLRDNAEILDGMIHPGLFTDAVQLEVQKGLLKNKTIVFTCAAAKALPAVKEMKTLENFCKRNKAQTFILPVGTDRELTDIHVDFAKFPLVYRNSRINNNLWINPIRIPANSSAPLSGLKRLGQRGTSQIFMSSKQSIDPVATSNGKTPHDLITTGAITLPSYAGSTKAATLAESDHVLGGVIVEVVNDEIFHYHMFQFDEDGGFFHLGKKYFPDGTIKNVDADVMVFGDWHTNEIDKEVRAVLLKAARELRVKRTVFHDIFSGVSINHHEAGNKVSLAKRAENGDLSLSVELVNLAKEIKDAIKNIPTLAEVVVVKSNHDIFLDNYIKDGVWIDHPQNARVSNKLFNYMLDGKDPLKAFVNNDSGVLSDDEKKKVRWLKDGEDYYLPGNIINRCQLGAHGHKGGNGHRNPTLAELESIYGFSVTGHAHAKGMLRGATRVGTSTCLDLGYNRGGGSSWTHTSYVGYIGCTGKLLGTLFNIIDGDYRKRK